MKKVATHLQHFVYICQNVGVKRLAKLTEALKLRLKAFYLNESCAIHENVTEILHVFEHLGVVGDFDLQGTIILGHAYLLDILQILLGFLIVHGHLEIGESCVSTITICILYNDAF